MPAHGLAAVVELGRALGRLPRRRVVVGIESGRFDHGDPMSDAVAALIASRAAGLPLHPPIAHLAALVRTRLDHAGPI